MDINVTKVVAHPENDVLEVWGWSPDVLDDHNVPLKLYATGWLSAMTNHYDEADYEDDGQGGKRLKGHFEPSDGVDLWVQDAEPHEMTHEEAQVYWKRLLQDVVSARTTTDQVLL